MNEERRELALYRFLAELNHQLQQVRDAERALRVALRMAREFYAADVACILHVEGGTTAAVPIYVLPRGATWEVALEHPADGARPSRLPDELLRVPVARRGRAWAHMLFQRRETAFDRTDVQAARRIAETVSRLVRNIDRIRSAEVRSRIDRKMMEQLRPKDLFYQILDGLRSLTLYDHSAGIFIHEEGPNSLELVAEKITWRKGKSKRIGKTLPLDGQLAALLETGDVFGFDRVNGAWREWEGRGMESLATVLDYDSHEPHAGCMLCAPLPTRGGFVGVIRIASCDPGGLSRYEADLMRRLLPQAAVAIQNLQRAESLQLGMLEAERKHALANLARGVTHDINNAFGAVLPLVQQMLAEVRAGRIDNDVMAGDLEQIESSVQTCRRIFGGMLAFARSGAHSSSEGDLRRAIESTLAILADSLRSHGIDIRLDLAEPLPLLAGGQSDLEQLLLNLATNARDAMPEGGTLTIRAHPADTMLAIEIADDGKGIAPDLLARVQEPFFTTKRHGTGLGLSICRSIAWNLKGRMKIDSAPDKGTRVRLHLPLAEAPA